MKWLPVIANKMLLGLGITHSQGKLIGTRLVALSLLWIGLNILDLIITLKIGWELNGFIHSLTINRSVFVFLYQFAHYSAILTLIVWLAHIPLIFIGYKLILPVIVLGVLHWWHKAYLLLWLDAVMLLVVVFNVCMVWLG